MTEKSCQEKYEQLKESLSALGGVAIAFSGGVDSTLLLKVAHDVLRENAVAVTVRSHVLTDRELCDAIGFCKEESIEHIILDVDELQIEGFAENPPDRCYLCKTEVLKRIRQTAGEKGIRFVAEGSNLDDDSDYRPGMRAVQEQGVLSPLRDAFLTKEEIRMLSNQLGLKTWDKPSFACLASRIPYGEIITAQKLSMIERAEGKLADLGLRQLRVRCHGNLARIETDEEGFRLFSDRSIREEIYRFFREIGFEYTAIDLLGYRTGSMNETIGE